MDRTYSNYQRIWHVVKLIPTGKVASYGQVADLAGLPGRARLVSRALAKAPKALQLPWYRVLNSQGFISIPSDNPAHAEQYTHLQAEGIQFNGRRVRLACYGWKPTLDEIVFYLSYPYEMFEED